MDKDLPHAYTQDNCAGSIGSACKTAEHHAKGCMRERWCLHSLRTGCVSLTSNFVLRSEAFARCMQATAQLRQDCAQ